jgi:hypothetical protein
MGLTKFHRTLLVPALHRHGAKRMRYGSLREALLEPASMPILSRPHRVQNKGGRQKMAVVDETDTSRGIRTLIEPVAGEV